MGVVQREREGEGRARPGGQGARIVRSDNATTQTLSDAALRGPSKPTTSGLIAASEPPTLSCAPLNHRNKLRDNFDLIDKPSDKMARVNEGDAA
jgi:hypothetical protein